jgi:hypothetical protein
MQRLLPRLLLALLAGVAGSLTPSCEFSVTDQLPRLSDQEFWRLTVDLSEPGGTFQSDNLVSNEGLGLVAQAAERTPPGRVYLGVGPEQNFSYIAALKPSLAFIIDIRRGNLHVHLMNKALFELSADRADFVAKLLTRRRPAEVLAGATAAALMQVFQDAPRGSESEYAANLLAIHEHLTKTRGLPLSDADLAGIAQVYRAFFWYGLAINYGAGTDLRPVPDRIGATYSDLMASMDRTGVEPSFLGSEAKFAYVKALHVGNLIVPVVGNFAGPHSLRAVGAYLKDRGGIVGALYVSNVETYLYRDNTWRRFCANVGAMPFDDASVLIRPSGPTALPGGIGVVSIAAAIAGCR